jgi:chromate transport protein ChrA
VGALLVSVLIVTLVGSLKNLPSVARPIAAAHIATVGVLVSSTYGMWQLWLHGAIAVSALVLIVTARSLLATQPKDIRLHRR